MAQGNQDSSCAGVARRDRARARNLSGHTETCEEFSQRHFPTRCATGLFRRSQPCKARRDPCFCQERSRNKTLLARRNWGHVKGSFGAVINSGRNRRLYRFALGRTTWPYVGLFNEPALDDESLGWLNVTRSVRR